MPLYTRDRNGNVQAAADQIVWAGDTNLYRSAADTLKTDDALVVAGGVAVTRTAVGDNSFTAALPGDANPRYIVVTSGTMYWGDGTVPADTGLRRAGVSALRTDGAFAVAGSLAVTGTSAFTGAVTGLTKTTVGLANVDNTADSAKPVSTAQAAALALKFDKTGGALSGAIAMTRTAALSTGYISQVTADAQARFLIYANGYHAWGDGAVAQDTTLYRLAANSLKTDGKLDVAGLLNLAAGAAGVGGLTIGADVNLYRSAADTLRTDDALQVGGALTVTGSATVGGTIGFTGALATSSIQTTRGAALSAFLAYVTGDTVARWRIDTNGKTEWGPGASVAADTNLYRAVAGVLKTDGVFRPGSFTTALRPTAAAAGVGGNIFDTTLNRPIWSTGAAWVDAMGTAV